MLFEGKLDYLILRSDGQRSDGGSGGVGMDDGSSVFMNNGVNDDLFNGMDFVGLGNLDGNGNFDVIGFNDGFIDDNFPVNGDLDGNGNFDGNFVDFKFGFDDGSLRGDDLNGSTQSGYGVFGNGIGGSVSVNFNGSGHGTGGSGDGGGSDGDGGLAVGGGFGDVGGGRGLVLFGSGVDVLMPGDDFLAADLDGLMADDAGLRYAVANGGSGSNDFMGDGLTGVADNGVVGSHHGRTMSHGGSVARGDVMGSRSRVGQSNYAQTNQKSSHCV